MKSIYQSIKLFSILLFIHSGVCADSSTTYIANVTYPGNKIWPSKFLSVMPIETCKVVSKDIIEQSRDSLQQVYINHGYLFSEITWDTSRNKSYYKIGNYYNVNYRINPGVKFKIKNISFKGNKGISEGNLKAHFGFKEKKLFWGGNFVRNEFKSKLDSLLKYFNTKGYIDAHIVSDSIQYDTLRKWILLSINIEDGIKYRFGNISFNGNNIIDYNTIRPLFWIRSGEVYNQYKIDVGKDSVYNIYGDNGYPFVSVSQSLKRHSDTCDVEINITPNQLVHVRKININVENNYKTREKVIRREILLMPGCIYNHSLLLQSINNIWNTNYFSDVKYQIEDNKDGTVDIIFNIREKDPIS
jgi:outer membrane protein insertion porin family